MRRTDCRGQKERTDEVDRVPLFAKGTRSVVTTRVGGAKAYALTSVMKGSKKALHVCLLVPASPSSACSTTKKKYQRKRKSNGSKGKKQHTMAPDSIHVDERHSEQKRVHKRAKWTVNATAPDRLQPMASSVDSSLFIDTAWSALVELAVSSLDVLDTMPLARGSGTQVV